MSKTFQQLSQEAKIVMGLYSERHPDVKIDRDYFPFKVSEEWGECLQAFLMLTDRGRQKDKTKDEIKEMLEKEMADVFGFLLVFADSEGIDLEAAMQKKWFKRLPKE